MSRPITNNLHTLNLYCGYSLNEKERETITELALYEMSIIPIHNRRKPFQLVLEAKRIAYFKKWESIKERRFNGR